MEGYDEYRSRAPLLIFLCDDDATSPLVCPPYSKVVVGEGVVAGRQEPSIYKRW